jgi:hypothetical protein
MPHKIIKPLFFIILLFSFASIKVSAASLSNIKTPNLFAVVGYGDNFSYSQTQIISTKRGEKYDETKDPALRRGTENQEQPQGSFFAIPATVVGIILLFLFFNRDS